MSLHLDNDNEDCNCDERECQIISTHGIDEAACPECGEFEDVGLVCGDHGYKCYNCRTRYFCP